MNILNTKAGMVTAAVVAGGLVLWWLAKRAGGALADAAGAVGTAVNPLDADNLAHRAVNATGAAITGNTDWSLGSAIYDLLHAEYDPNAPAKTHILNARSDADGRPSSIR